VLTPLSVCYVPFATHVASKWGVGNMVSIKVNLKPTKMRIHFFMNESYQATMSVPPTTDQLWPIVVFYSAGEAVEIRAREKPLRRSPQDKRKDVGKVYSPKCK